MPSDTDVKVSVNGIGADDSPMAAAIEDAVNDRSAHDELVDAVTDRVAEIIDPDGDLGLHEPDELPGMPEPVRPRFEGVEIHTLEVTFQGTIKLTCTPGNVAEHQRFKLGQEVELVVTGIVVDRPMGGLKLDDEGCIDWSKTRSRAVIKIHSFDTPAS